MTSPISPMETLTARADFERFFDQNAIDIFDPTEARTSNGGTTHTYAATPTRSVRGIIAPMDTQDTAFYADKLGGRMGWWVTVPAGTSVDPSMRLKIGTRSFELISTDSVRSDQWTIRMSARELT